MSDADIIAAAVGRWHRAGELPTDGEARVAASQWHGGQATALYSFASTGAITDALSLEVAQEILRQPDYQQAPELLMLQAYIASHGNRGPVEGWHTLWG